MALSNGNGRQPRTLHLFEGGGGGLLADLLLGHTPVCGVEIEPYPRDILLARQRDGILPRFPIWDDVTTFDGKPWRGHVDVVCGGFPCQDISAAGRGLGLTGSRSGLWSEMARIIREIQPARCFVENSPLLTSRGIGVVLGDLAEMGYDARWGVFSAADLGAQHERERIWIVAHTKKVNHSSQGHNGNSGEHLRPQRKLGGAYFRTVRKEGRSRLLAEFGESGLDRVAYDLAFQVDRLGTIGNGQVPIVAALAYRILESLF